MTRGERGRGEVEDGIGGINDDGRRIDLGWWTHNMMYRWCVIELYTWNIEFYYQSHPYQFNKKEKMPWFHKDEQKEKKLHEALKRRWRD